MANTAEKNVGALVNLTAPRDGGITWTARQIDQDHKPPPGPPEDSVDVDWAYGPVKVFGNLNKKTYELGVSVSVLGIDVGNIKGNLREGVKLDIKLSLAIADIRFYLKNGNEFWTHLDIKIMFDGTFVGDYKILHF